MRQRPPILQPALLTLSLLVGITLHLPAQAAGKLDRLAPGVIAPGDITGAIIFGKNGEVIPLDAKGKPLAPCAMPRGTGPDSKKNSLPECQSGSASEANGPKPKAAGVPCEGYYLIWIGGYPVKIWFPVGCTPP
jgi:hypothetical protein